MEIYIKLWQNAKRDEADQEQNSRVNASEEVVGHHAQAPGNFSKRWMPKLNGARN